MTNLIISRVCNLACEYCFARDAMQTWQSEHVRQYISLSRFEKHLDALDHSGIREIRLLGGEPTLHPEFIQLVQQALPRGRRILLFSHGWLDEKTLAFLETLPDTAMRVMINMNAQPGRGMPPMDLSSPRREAILRRLGSRATLGYNIHQPAFDLEPLVRLIDATGIHRVIRLGLAQPVWGGENAYLHPKQYPAVGQKIAWFGAKASQAGIKLEFDCGFVPCMFPEVERKTLQELHPDLGWHCNPIPDLDFDGQAFHCFPLAGKISTTCQNSESPDEVRKRLRDQSAAYRSAGIYRECSSCSMKLKGECPGGCLSATLRRYRQANSKLVIPRAKLLHEQHVSTLKGECTNEEEIAARSI